MLEDLISRRISEAVRPHLTSSVESFARDEPPITGSSYKSGDTNEITGANQIVGVDAKDETEETKILPTAENAQQPAAKYGLLFAALLILIVGVGFFLWHCAAFLKEKSFSGAKEEHKGWLILEAQVEAAGDNSEKARALLVEAVANEYVRENPAAYAWETALSYAGLGDKEKTLEWLEKAEAARDHGIIFIEAEPRPQQYRNDEHFIALANKVKTPLHR